MGTAKSPRTSGFGTAWQILQFLARPHNRALVLTALIAAAAAMAAVYGWQRWGAATLAGNDYQITPEGIVVTPQPPWVHADVKTEVLRLAGSETWRLQDRQVVEHLAQAFALHPWVGSVERVEKKYPARVEVTLRYRRPVLVVKMEVANDQGLLFLDEEGVLLPSADFAPSQARDYLRIAASGEAPAGGYGSPWNSPRILGAARIAAVFGTRWQAAGLYWLVASRPASGELIYELRTQDDRARVIWGSAVGHESPGEAAAEEKIAALERYVHDKGTLAREGVPDVIDLRELARGK
jgi:hypothetical protein